MRRSLLSLLLPSLLYLFAPAAAPAAWLANGNIVAHPGQRATVRLAPDASGGVFVSWETGYTEPLMLTRILADGEVAEGWTATDPRGLPLFPRPWWGYPQSAIGDETGGVFVVDEAVHCPTTCGGDAHYLLATRVHVDAVRAAGWGIDGDTLGFIGDSKTRPDLASAPDGRGGVLGAWTVRPFPFASYLDRELRAQRMDATGAMLWSPEGVLVGGGIATPAHDFALTVVPDGGAGAFIFWLAEHATAVFGQHLSAAGEALWPVGGIAVVRPDASPIARYRAISDGSHGVILVWSGTSGRQEGLFVTRLRGDGTRAMDGLLAAVSPPDAEFRLASVRGGGALACWREQMADSSARIVAQRINHGGQPLWGRGAVASMAASHKAAVTIVEDGSGGAYLAWADSRPEAEVYAMHLDRWGRPASGWGTDGSPICERLGEVQSIELVSDSEDGAYVAWTDARVTPSLQYQVNVGSLMRLTPGGPAAAPAGHEAQRAPRRAEVVRIEGRAPALVVDAVEPNPSFGTSVVRFSLIDTSPAMLELFDVTGRRMWSLGVGSLGAGEHAVRLGDTVWIPAGVYLVRLTQGGRAASARLSIVR